jgi:crotonobetainyl-CoA:carnitine CoA-transferase CaiB-like acyl-CoA transferase
MSTEPRPLDGVRVVNLAVNVPGPVAARRLGQLGARVVKIEPPGGDPLALYVQGWYEALVEGVERRVLDLKSPEGALALRALLAEADVVITAHRPAALRRLGLAPEVLAGDFPRLCQVAITGLPAPRDDEAGHDLTYQAGLGLVEPPHLPRTLLADLAGAEQAVSAALALLYARERTGRGGVARVSLAEAAATFAEPLRVGLTGPGSLLGGGLPEYALYRTADGWVALAALEPRFRQRLRELLGVDAGEGYAQVFATRCSAEWLALARAHDVPLEIVRETPT